ncbi:MAG: hypothetical protein V4727_09210 [Verrucomicrobiota bacterium]
MSPAFRLCTPRASVWNGAASVPSFVSAPAGETNHSTGAALRLSENESVTSRIAAMNRQLGLEPRLRLVLG